MNNFTKICYGDAKILVLKEIIEKLEKEHESVHYGDGYGVSLDGFALAIELIKEELNR
jgi:hypothetical protein